LRRVLQSRFREWWREAAGALVVLATRILTAPRTPWENDEFLFAEGVRNFDPSRYHPHPPGYPLYVLIGKLVDAVLHDPWRALVIVAIVAAPIGFVAMARAFRNWMDDADLAVCAALIFYFSASMMVHGTLALSDGLSIAFVGLAMWAVSAVTPAESRRHVEPDHVAPALQPAHDRTAIAVGLWCSAAIGCRPQLLVPMLPMMVIAIWRMSTMRQRVACVATFGFVSLMWFLPLVDAAGGLQQLIAYETKQAAYVAAHDAAMSRGAKTTLQLALRFLIHPWGSKYVTVPLLACFALGMPAVIRRWRVLLPLLVFTAIQCAFELTAMDPADAARYHLPAMIFDAMAVGFGLDVIRRSAAVRALPWIGALFFAAISFAYVKPIIAARTAGASPPAAAAEFANAHFAPNTVILYDYSLRPAAEYLMRFPTQSVEKGLAAIADRPDVPAVMFVDGGSSSAEAKTFSWPESDAYGKLTRNLYRRVTLDPVRPSERYLPLAGVYALERTTDGDEWRWLAREAALRMPATHGSRVRLGFRLSPDSPYETNNVHVSVNGVDAGVVAVHKHDASTIEIALPAGNAEIAMRAEQAFAPASVLRNQDPRILSVQLVGLDQL
jgi:hypothetical protein